VRGGRRYHLIKAARAESTKPTKGRLTGAANVPAVRLRCCA
jgi:hypothetical protein